MIAVKIRWLLLWVLIMAIEHNAYAIDREKFKQYKQRQQTRLLEQAKQAADGHDFSHADELLKAARNASYHPDKIKTVEKYIADERAVVAKAEREQRLAEQRRASQSSYSSAGSSSSSSSCKTFVSFTFDAPGPDHDSSLSMSGPSGVYSDCNDNLCSFSGGCIAGSYTFNYVKSNTNWIGPSEAGSWSGNFSIGGEKSYCIVTIAEVFGTSISVYCN